MRNNSNFTRFLRISNNWWWKLFAKSQHRQTKKKKKHRHQICISERVSVCTYVCTSDWAHSYPSFHYVVCSHVCLYKCMIRPLKNQSQQKQNRTKQKPRTKLHVFVVAATLKPKLQSIPWTKTKTFYTVTAEPICSHSPPVVAIFSCCSTAIFCEERPRTGRQEGNPRVSVVYETDYDTQKKTKQKQKWRQPKVVETKALSLGSCLAWSGLGSTATQTIDVSFLFAFQRLD